MFMLKYGHPPFVAGNLLNLYNKIQNDPLVFPSHTKISPSLQDLLENMLRKDPNERYTLDKVVLHPWIRYPPPNPIPNPNPGATAAATTASNEKLDSSIIPANSKPRLRASPQNSADEIEVPISIQAHFTPPDSYNDEEAAAMETPVKEVNMEDMFKSISVSVVGKSKSIRGKSKTVTGVGSGAGAGAGAGVTPSAGSERISATNTTDNDKDKNKDTDKDKGIDDDMMLSGWGADVFEIVHVGEEINSDSDDDSDDADDIIVDTTTVPSMVGSCDATADVSGVADTAKNTDADIDNYTDNLNIPEDQNCLREGSSSGDVGVVEDEVEKEKTKLSEKRQERLVVRHSAEYPAISAVSVPTVCEDTSKRRMMDADEEILRSSKFRSQLSKRSIKEALVRELRSKKNSVERHLNLRSSEMNPSSSDHGPCVARTPYTDEPSTADDLTSCARSSNSKASTPDKVWSRDADEYAECTGELSIEEFRNMMDTLTTKIKSEENDGDGETLDPVDFTLDTVNFSSQLMNVHNGIGVAYHSEKGQREFQEDRCCLVPNVAEALLQAALDQGVKSVTGTGAGTGTGLAGSTGVTGGSKSQSRRGSFLCAAHADRDDRLGKISIVCLFDGHSGSGCSEFLSKTFVNMLVRHEMFLDDSPEAALVDVCRIIDGQVRYRSSHFCSLLLYHCSVFM